jgi:RNA polymerase sigma-70 factor (ECF subfamily)
MKAPGSPSEHPSEGDRLTSFHLRQARGGDKGSLEWVVKRFTPLLLANARYRMGDVLRRYFSPEDVVNDVWCITLPKLHAIGERGRRVTPAVVKFLSSATLYRCHDLLKKVLHRRPPSAPDEIATMVKECKLDSDLPDDTRGVITRLVSEEGLQALAAAIEALPERDRQLLILRGLEQQPYKAIAAVLGGDANVLSAQYHRALGKLRKLLAGSVLDDVDPD